MLLWNHPHGFLENEIQLSLPRSGQKTGGEKAHRQVPMPRTLRKLITPLR